MARFAPDPAPQGGRETATLLCRGNIYEGHADNESGWPPSGSGANLTVRWTSPA